MSRLTRIEVKSLEELQKACDSIGFPVSVQFLSAGNGKGVAKTLIDAEEMFALLRELDPTETIFIATA